MSKKSTECKNEAVAELQELLKEQMENIHGGMAIRDGLRTGLVYDENDFPVVGDRKIGM